MAGRAGCCRQPREPGGLGAFLSILTILTEFAELPVLQFWELLGWRAQGERGHRDEPGHKENKGSALKPCLHPSRALLVHWMAGFGDCPLQRVLVLQESCSWGSQMETRCK